MSYRADKPRFLEFWVKMAKMSWKVKVNDPYFQYQPRVYHDAWLVQIWWFQLISVTSYHVDKLKFMDRRTDRRTGRHRQWQYPFGLKGHGVKSHKLWQWNIDEWQLFEYEEETSFNHTISHFFLHVEVILYKVSLDFPLY